MGIATTDFLFSPVIVKKDDILGITGKIKPKTPNINANELIFVRVS